MGGGVLSYSDLFSKGSFDDWHHYAVVWDTDGIPGLENKGIALYVDGQIHTSAAWNLSEEDAALSAQPLTLCIGRGVSGSKRSFDEFKIWDYAKTDFKDSLIDPAKVSGVIAHQHYPWNGKIDIQYNVYGDTDGLSAKIVVRDVEHDVSYDVKTVEGVISAAAGTHEIIWDATADGVDQPSTNMVATVSLIVGE